MSIEEFNYAEDLAIDPDCLDEECLKQPGLYMKYAVAHADAIRTKDRLWEILKIKRSELIKWANSNPGKMDGGKATLPIVEAYYRSHPEHQSLKDQLIEAEYVVNVLQGAVSAFGYQRKSSLEGEITMWLGGYFAGPKEPRVLPGGKRVIDMKALALARVSKEVRESLNDGKESVTTKEGDSPSLPPPSPESRETKESPPATERTPRTRRK